MTDQKQTNSLLWCNSHQREVRPEIGRCDPLLGGITIPCQVVDLTGQCEVTKPQLSVIKREKREPIARDLAVGSADHRSCDVCGVDGVDMIEIRGRRACGYCGNTVMLCPTCSILMVQDARL